MKYYAYKSGYCVASFESHNIQDALVQATKINLVFDGITTVYQPEPRTVGEVLDDSIYSTKTVAKAITLTGRRKLANVLGWAQSVVQVQPPMLTHK